jgi:mono/diheme cytochrome c family protein
MQVFRPLLLIPFALFVTFRVAAAEESKPLPTTSEQLEFYTSQVLPILKTHCLKCHGGGKTVKGGLRLTSRENILKGGETGPAVSLDQPQESLLLEAINYQEFEMPPSGKLSAEHIAILTRWVKGKLAGAPEKVAAVDSHDKTGPPQVNEKNKQFWSFQPVARPDVPPTKRSDWIRNPIDAFILSRLEAANLSPALPAMKTSLLRRATYDLIGLPPTPEEVAAFLADDSPDAFERVIDRLLESPHYGERWARHWLDLVRYAETNSYERDGAKPFVWRYRDYVIQAFNNDKPYDQFVIEQLAGDELDDPTTEAIIATGYYRLGLWQDEPVDKVQELFEDIDDLVRTTAEVFLGVTVGCARCHDHKLDPIPQRDYYRMAAFFRNVQRYGVRSGGSVEAASLTDIGTPEERQRHAAQVKAHQEELRDTILKIDPIDKLVKADLKGVENDEWRNERRRPEFVKKRIGTLLTKAEFDEYRRLVKRRNELKRFKPPGLEKALCVKEHGRTSPPTHVLIRGNAHAPAAEVTPGFLEILSPPEPNIAEPAAEAKSTGRRRVLANWIASKSNPLTARVMVNRIWHYHFGRGLVRSTSDFGFQGTPPTHPELLNWLASDFVDSGWKIKRFHKLIMLSSTYQMSSKSNALALEKDPVNQLFWRFDMRRLSAEEIRDSILAANGSLTLDRMFGPSFYPIIPREVMAGQSKPGAGWGNSSPEERARRSIYIHSKRSLVVPMIASFDGADTDSSCPVRFNTTQPTQALGMLNSVFMMDQATVFSKYLQSQVGDDPTKQIALALQRVTQRNPTDKDVQRGVALVDTLQKKHDVPLADALRYFCLTVLNLNEFVYLD